MHRARRTTALLAVSGLSVALALAGPATAAPAGFEEFCAPVVPPTNTTVGNAAPTAVDDEVTVDNGFYSDIDVLANDSDPDGDPLSIVSVGSSTYGDACADNGVVSYAMYDAVDGTSDTFQYAVTDGDFYRTATLHVLIRHIAADLPSVTTRLKVRNGVVVRRALVTVTNPDPQRTVLFLAGRFSEEQPRVVRELAPGGTATFRTSLPKVDFVTVAEDDGDPISGVMTGRINAVTGVVRELYGTGARSVVPVAHRWTAGR